MCYSCKCKELCRLENVMQQHQDWVRAEKQALLCRYKLSACVDGLKSMGFPYESASKAARIAAGDADHAIELLMSGVLTNLREPLTFDLTCALHGLC